MKEALLLAEKNYLITGFVGMIAGWGSAIMAKLQVLNELFTSVGALFGTISAFFAMLILIRKWWKDKD